MLWTVQAAFIFGIVGMLPDAAAVHDRCPLRGDAVFGGDYAAYRKAYKAWNERERTRRKKVALQIPSRLEAGRCPKVEEMTGQGAG